MYIFSALLLVHDAIMVAQVPSCTVVQLFSNTVKLVTVLRFYHTNVIPEYSQLPLLRTPSGPRVSVLDSESP